MTGVDIFNTKVAVCTPSCFWVTHQSQVTAMGTQSSPPTSLGLRSTPQTQR